MISNLQLTAKQRTPWVIACRSFTSHIPTLPHLSPTATSSLVVDEFTANDIILLGTTFATCSSWK